jgi:hypothetical protein
MEECLLNNWETVAENMRSAAGFTSRHPPSPSRGSSRSGGGSSKASAAGDDASDAGICLLDEEVESVCTAMAGNLHLADEDVFEKAPSGLGTRACTPAQARLAQVRSDTATAEEQAPAAGMAGCHAYTPGVRHAKMGGGVHCSDCCW